MSPPKRTAVKAASMPKPKGPKKLKVDHIAEYKEQLAKDGTVAMLTLADDDVLAHVKRFVSTQSIALDKAIGRPGFPCGRITEILGDEATGKSTLSDHVLAQTQAEDGVAILLDNEQARDRQYTTRLGVDPDRLIIMQPKENTLESTFDCVDNTIEFWKKYPDKLVTIVVDSVGGTPTRGDLTRPIGDRRPGEAASVIHHAVRVLGTKIAQRDVCLVVVNQLYERIGWTHGDNRIGYGGRGLRYHASLRLMLGRGETIKRSDGAIVGHEIKVDIKKSKVAASSGSKCAIGIIHGVGIDNVYALFGRLQQNGNIKSAGGWHSLDVPETESVKFQGGHFGLLAKCHDDPTLFGKMLEIYKALP